MQIVKKISRTMLLVSCTLCFLGMVSCSRDTPESMLASAKDYLAKKDNKAAVIQIKNALQKNPDLAEARYLLGKTLLETGDASGAEIELRKAQALHYSADLVVPRLAQSLVLQNQMRKLIDEFGGTSLNSPESKADLAISLATAQGTLGNREGAETSIKTAQAVAPDYVPAQIMRVRALGTSGDFAGAIAMLDTILAKHPDNYEGWKLKGDLLIASRKPGEGLAAYRKSIEVKPDFVMAHSAVVSALVQSGKVDEAVQAFEQMKKVASQHPLTAFVAAQLAFQKKDYRAARESIDQVLKQAPGNILAQQLAGAIEFQSRSYIRAENYFLKVLQASPDNMGARRLLILTYMREGRTNKAMDALEPVVSKIDNDAPMLLLAGEVYIQNGKTDKAEEYFARALKLDPNDPGKRTSLAMAHLIGGNVNGASSELEQISGSDKGTSADMALISTYLRRNELDKALKAIAVLDTKQPNNPATYSLRARTLIAKKDLAGARKSFEQALQINPAFLPAATGLASLDLIGNDVPQAKKRFDSVIAADPKNVGAMLAAAELTARTGGTPVEVQSWITKAITANPEDTGARLALVEFYLRTNEPKKATTAAQEAVAAIPDRPELLDAVGRAQAASGDTNRALDTFGKLASLQPDSAAPYMRMATVQVNAGQKDSAVESLRHALRLQPNLIEAQRALIAISVSMQRQSDALAVARDVKAQRPKEAIGYVLEGDIFAVNKAWFDAISSYQAGLKVARVPELAVKLHTAYLANGNKAEADALTQSWLKDHPSDADFRLYLADRANLAKDYATAVANYRTVLALQPQNTAVMNNLAWSLGQIKDPKALEYAETANRMAPNQPAFMDTLAVLLADSGDTKRALDLMEQAIKLAPQALSLHLNYARILVKAGKKTEAKKELEELAKLGDKFAQQSEAKVMLDSL